MFKKKLQTVIKINQIQTWIEEKDQKKKNIKTKTIKSVRNKIKAKIAQKCTGSKSTNIWFVSNNRPSSVFD